MSTSTRYSPSGRARGTMRQQAEIAHLGGCTGDTLGATVEVVEAVILVTATSGL